MQKILIVEDEKAIANLIKINLVAEGYRCTCAYDGETGADYIEKETFDLILLDIMLPEINGYELLEYVKPIGTPVIFLTAKGNVSDRIKGLLWMGTGFCLLYMRLEAGSFSWPRTTVQAAELTEEQFRYLMLGLNPLEPKVKEVSPTKIF